MCDQAADLLALLGKPRLAPYLEASGGDLLQAFELYTWSAEIGGAMHPILAFVEIAVRNSLDPVIGEWNAAQGGQHGRDWTRKNCAAQPLYLIMKESLNAARGFAQRASDSRPSDHARYGADPTHDDILAQLPFGSWANLVFGQPGNDSRQASLWRDCTHLAFPALGDDESSRKYVGVRLNRLRLLRNRIAHHENLLDVQAQAQLRTCLALLSKINPEFPSLAMTRNRVRSVVNEDPRRQLSSLYGRP